MYISFCHVTLTVQFNSIILRTQKCADCHMHLLIDILFGKGSQSRGNPEFDKQLLASSCLSVCLSTWNNPAPTGWIFIKYDIGVLFQNLSVKFNFHQNVTRLTGNLHEDVYLVHTNTSGSITNFFNTWQFLGDIPVYEGCPKSIRLYFFPR